VYVFDVSQTEGKELPSLTDVAGDVSGYRERLIEYVESQKITLKYSEKIAPQRLVFGRQNHPAQRDAASRGILNSRA
jgi:hypothetical protein